MSHDLAAETGPFGSPILVALDALRLLMVAGAIYICAHPIDDFRRMRTPGQQARHLGVICGAVGIAIVQFTRLGDYPSAALVFFLATIALQVYGVWGLRHREEPALPLGQTLCPPPGPPRRLT